MKPKEIEALEARLENWRVWWASYNDSRGVGCCGSVESRYVAPRPDDEAVSRGAGSTVDVADAETVHAALQALPLNPIRRFFFCWYGRSMPKHVYLRKCKLTDEQFDPFRERNLELLAIQLVRLEKSTVVLIRRGAPIWSGIAIPESGAYKASSAHRSASGPAAMAGSARPEE